MKGEAGLPLPRRFRPQRRPLGHSCGGGQRGETAMARGHARFRLSKSALDKIVSAHRSAAHSATSTDCRVVRRLRFRFGPVNDDQPADDRNGDADHDADEQQQCGHASPPNWLSQPASADRSTSRSLATPHQNSAISSRLRMTVVIGTPHCSAWAVDVSRSVRSLATCTVRSKTAGPS